MIKVLVSYKEFDEKNLCALNTISNVHTGVVDGDLRSQENINSEDSNFNKSESCLCFYVEEDRYKTPNICNQL